MDEQNNSPAYPDGPPVLDEVVGWYLDSENSLVCEECATASNSLNEVPQFRPVTPVVDLTEEDTCGQCSRAPYPNEIPEN